MDRLLRLSDVTAITGLARSTIYRYLDKSKFPQPVRIGQFTVRWRESTINDWINSLPETCGKIPIPPDAGA